MERKTEKIQVNTIRGERGMFQIFLMRSRGLLGENFENLSQKLENIEEMSKLLDIYDLGKEN